jgi:hypothetical protein
VRTRGESDVKRGNHVYHCSLEVHSVQARIPTSGSRAEMLASGLWHLEDAVLAPLPRTAAPIARVSSGCSSREH